MGLYYLELPFMSVEFYVWAACIGFNITMVLVFFLKGAESKLMSSLLTSQSFSEESSRSLAEMGLNNKLIRFLLRDGSTLRKVVTLVGGGDRIALKKGAKARVDFDKAKFYISEDNKKRAESMKKSAVKWYMLPVFCAIAIGIAVGIHFLIPIIENW